MGAPSKYLYDAKLRLNNSLHNEIHKTSMTPAEVQILSLLHGHDALTEVKERKATVAQYDKVLTDSEGVQWDEREYLFNKYGRAMTKLEPATTIGQLFGPPSMPMPQRLGSFEREEADAAAAKKEAKAAAAKQKDTQKRSASSAELSQLVG